MPLPDVIDQRRDEIVARWSQRVQSTVAPRLSAPELVDHLPDFLDALIAALRGNEKTSRRELPKAAAIHGRQRLRLGFDLEALVHEYGLLHHAITDTARAAGDEPTEREMHVLFDAILDGIAHAVSEYTRRSDGELLRQANESFAFVAHELRNPLFSALMAVRILKTSGHLPAEGHAVEALERGLHQTMELMDHSLDLARAASGIDVKQKATTLRERLELAHAGVSAEAEAKNVELHLEAEDAQVVVDIRLVQSALDNLTRNAVDHTPSGETVKLGARVSDGHVVFEVEDCCGGLSHGDAERMFAPSSERGGLGLAIAKQAVEAHGGTIRVRNLPGKGCVFVLELPVTPPVDATSAR